MIKISVQDFNIESIYSLKCQVCGKILNFVDHPFDLDEIVCKMCKTKYCLVENIEHSKEKS